MGVVLLCILTILLAYQQYKLVIYITPKPTAMKQIFVFLLSFSCLTGLAQSNKIIIGNIDSIQSKILNEQRKVWVHVPDSEPNSLYSKETYPVVYLMDGDAHFYSVMGLIQQMSEVNGNSLYPKMIVVGIPNTDRMRDLTPTKSSFDPFGVGGLGDNTGGGEKFTEFMDKELIPYIEANYPTAPHRVLIGHSLGGLMVINTFLHHTNLFNSYLSIDPSMWWDDHKLLNQLRNSISTKNFNGRSLFLGIANTMPAGMDTTMVRKDTVKYNMHIRSILQLADVMNEKKPKGLRWSYKYYADDDHGSVPLIAEYDALRFMFSDFRMPFVQALFEPGNTMNGDSAITAHYKKLSSQMGYDILPPEPLINGLGYNFLQSKQMDRSLRFFNMNIRNYPKSFNAYDSMGDYYDAAGDKKKAIEFYTKALTFREYPETRQKLEKLKGEKK